PVCERGTLKTRKTTGKSEVGIVVCRIKILVHCAIGRSNIDLSRTEGEVPRRPALRVAAEGTGVVGMSDKNPDHRKINAQRQRNEVQTRIRAALEQLRSEALVEQSNGCTVASRRLSLASVLR